MMVFVTLVLFPFNHPPTTGMYLTLYVFTFALHQFFMHYVLAGSIWIALTGLLRSAETSKDPNDQHEAIQTNDTTQLIREWMPFQLSAAITAGVAPLLFIQILYPEHFYTANLLLWWRWMIVVPILIMAFYLMYFAKSRLVVRTGNVGRGLLSLLISGLIVFVGFCWTANYVVSANPQSWVSTYASGAPQLELQSMLLRMGIWLFGSFATLALFVTWQLADSTNSKTNRCTAPRGIVLFGCTGLVASIACSAGYLTSIDDEARSAIVQLVGRPYLIAAAIGAIVQLVGWIILLRCQSIRRRWLSFVSAGYFVTLVSVAAIREVQRLVSMDVTSLYPLHAESADVGGFVLFSISCLVNFSLIGVCIGLVRRRQRADKNIRSTRL